MVTHQTIIDILSIWHGGDQLLMQLSHVDQNSMVYYLRFLPFSPCSPLEILHTPSNNSIYKGTWRVDTHS